MARKRLQPGIELGQIVREYARDEVSELVDQWLGVYAQNGFGSLSRQYLWHVFSSGSTPALEGPAALDRYEAQACAQYVVLANDRKSAFLTETRPVRNVLQDWFVFPPNMAWTMAFTHEEGWIGPFFATHPDHARLDSENQALLRGRRQSDTARQRDRT
jgi:hypothetical protein